MHEDNYKALKALGDGTRFQIMSMLLCHNLCVGALAKKLGISEAAVSQHLQVLKGVGLVTSEKRGYYVHNAANTLALGGLAEALHLWATQTKPQELTCRPAESGRCGGRCHHREAYVQEE
ncbi:MAG: metalloregulator ArsR/SmtB family transcription factor [Bacillota bacterium]|nr:metalloregulator ArsR/SmtB family transcription factor [Bacillota bacterium]